MTRGLLLGYTAPDYSEPPVVLADTVAPYRDLAQRFKEIQAIGSAGAGIVRVELWRKDAGRVKVWKYRPDRDRSNGGSDSGPAVQGEGTAPPDFPLGGATQEEEPEGEELIAE